MIITLIGADFSKNNIGTLTTWSIGYSTNISASVTADSNNPSSVDRTTNTGFTAIYTINDGYELSSTGVTVTMGGVVQDNVVTIDGSKITVTFTSVTGNVNISINTKVIGSTEPEDPIIPEEPDNSETIVAYTSRQSSSGISKSTGEYISSSTGYVNIYENIDPTKTYAVTSYAPSSTSDNACVCYYTSDGTFISAESGSDWGISSVEYTMQELTVPSTASIIKLFGRTNNQEAVLYLTSTISLREISYTSQKTSSNLNETTGEYGSSSSGYVNIYDNIDTSKTYYASGFCPDASGTAAFVCYYTSDGTFISSQDGNDFGASSQNVKKQKLTVPSNTSTIKVFAQSTSGYTSAALYVEQ